MNQIGPSIIRTVVPLIVAGVVSQLAKRGIDPGPYQDIIATVVGSLVAAGYYGAVRLLETYVKPRLGWLLGSAKAPTYDAPAAPSAASPTGFEATEAAPVPEGEPVTVEPVWAPGGAVSTGQSVEVASGTVFTTDYQGRHAADGDDPQPLVARH